MLMRVFYSGEEELRGGQNHHYYQNNHHQTLGGGQLQNYKSGKRDRTNSDQRRKKQSQVLYHQHTNQQMQRQPKPKSKSQDKFLNKKKSKVQDRIGQVTSTQNPLARQTQNHSSQNQFNLLNKISNIDMQKHTIIEEEDFSEQDQSKLLPRQLLAKDQNGVTKSTRELRTSMGFHELLNQLDKDISLQQSHQFDLKNKTSHDLLRLELSGIRRQNSSGANLGIQNIISSGNNGLHGLKSADKNGKQALKQKNKRQSEGTLSRSKGGARSRSNERGGISSKSKSRDRVKNMIGPIGEAANINMSMNSGVHLPKHVQKSLMKQKIQQQEKIFHYPIAEITPDRNQNHQGVTSNSFLQSEHGRQMPQVNTKSLKAHEEGLPPTNINVLFSKIKVQNNQQAQGNLNAGQNQKSHHHPPSATLGLTSSAQKRARSKSREPSSSPERQGGGMSKIGNIDKLIKDNLRRIRIKEEEEKQSKDEINKKKREQLLDFKNQQTKTLNKQRSINKHLKNQTAENSNQNQTLSINKQTSEQNLLSQEKIQKITKQLMQNEKTKQKISQILANGKINDGIQGAGAINIQQKQSQTQKIDFEKLKQSTKPVGGAKNLKVKNHRKSYGLEFIEIKKEIQEELRTIDLKYKNNQSNQAHGNQQLVSSKHNLLLQNLKPQNTINEESQTQINILLDSAEPVYHHFNQNNLHNSGQAQQQQRSKLKIKQSNKQTIQNGSNTKEERNQTTNEADSLHPNSKVLVLKKNKIRKFMEQKKKLILIQKIKEQKEEITKAIKMKQNICKLNDFCKKKLEKQHKKRNATIPVNQEEENSASRQNQLIQDMNARRIISKVNGRKILFDNIELKKTLNPKHSEKFNETLTYFNEDEEFGAGDDQDGDHDSSRLSTEFYEEYYRLINSIKKEQRILLKGNNSKHSRMGDVSSQNITQKSIKNLLSSPSNNNKSHSPLTVMSKTHQNLFSPKQSQQAHPKGEEKTFKKKSKSKSNLKHTEGGILLLNQNQAIQRSQGNLLLQPQQRKNQLNSIDNENFKNTLPQNQNHQKPFNLKERAESAPLLMNQQNQSLRKNSQAKRKSPGGKGGDAALRRKNSKKNNKQVQQISQQEVSEQDQLQYIIDQIIKIQSHYRQHLLEKGFYDKQEVPSYDDQEQSGQDTVVHNGTVLLNNFGSLTKSDNDNYNTQQFQNQQIPFSNPDSDIKQVEIIGGDDYNESDGEEQDEDDYYEEQQREEKNIQNKQIIIINQQINEDDKKIVYMSNINSCSLPQTPKVDEGSQPSQSQQSRKINQHIQKVFEYKPPGGDLSQSLNNNGGGMSQDLISQHLYANDLLHQSISQKPSILESHNSEVIPKLMDLKKPEGVMMLKDFLSSGKTSQDIEEQYDEEEEEKDEISQRFNIRNPLSQGLTEFNKPSGVIMQISNQPTVRQMHSHQQVSVQSQQYNKNSQQLNNPSLSALHSHTASSYLNPSQGAPTVTDMNSHSSQSLFERNSFQQFSQTKLQQLMQNNEFFNLLEIREKALAYRKSKEKKFIKKMYKDRKFSPRTYTSKKQQLEKWVQIEEEEIQKSKKQFEEEWQKTLKMIEDTQKDVDTMRQKMKIHIDNNHSHNSNPHHSVNNNNLLFQNQVNASNQKFNSHQSSRNSDSSYRTKEQVEPRKSILELEEFQPMSQRSVRLSVSSQKQNPNRSVDKYQAIKHLNQQDLSHSKVSQNKDRGQRSQESSVSTFQKQQQRIQDSVQREENLIDYLESSWIKNQKQIKEFNSSSTQQNNERVSDLRPSLVKNIASDILIQDQHSKSRQQESSSVSPSKQSQAEELHQKNMIFDYIQDSDEISQNLITERRDDATIQNIVHQFQQQYTNDSRDERPLTRSRSEQDLSDLLKKSNLNFNELEMTQNKEENENSRLLQHQLQLDSYRFDQRDGSNLLYSDPKQKQVRPTDQLKIQENMFEDSSHRFSKGKNYYPEHDDNDLQSNDSLLNESELNNYFQDQKFSIEDFKSLDKRKLAQNINEDQENNEEENSPEDVMNEYARELGAGSLIGRVESQINIHADESLKNIEDMENENSQSNLFQQSSSNKIDTGFDQIDQEPPHYYDGRRNFLNGRDEELKDLSQDNIFPTAFMHHQQALLFSAAKPGENIKISDILRKNQSLQDPSISHSFQLGVGDTSQLLFQNVHINQSMSSPSLNPLLNTSSVFDYQALADQITDEIIQSLLNQATTINKREFNEDIRVDSGEDHLASGGSINADLAAADVFIVNSQLNDKEHRRETAEFRMRIVIEQDLIRVENYINEVIQQLQQAELQYLTLLAHNPSMISTQESNYHRQFLQVLTTPIKKNEIDLLNMLQTSEIGSYDHFETTMDLNSFPILPIDLYLDIERQREENQIRMLYQNGINDVDLESSVMQESTHIHNKSIFDALNESLMKFRPYGIQGEPMPWSNKNRRLQTKVDTNSVDTERLFFMVKQDVMRWAQTFSGCSPSPIFLFRRQLPTSQSEETEQFDDELFQETRERRLATMLATEVVENEHQWLNYEFEEAQVKIDLSDMILEHLVEEAVVFLNPKNVLEGQGNSSSSNSQC